MALRMADESGQRMVELMVYTKVPQMAAKMVI